MEEALSWPGQVLSNGHVTEGKVLLAWGVCVAYGKPLRDDAPARLVALYVVPGSRTGSQRIADYRTRRAVALR